MSEVIRLEGIGKVFGQPVGKDRDGAASGGVEVLKGIDLTIEAGEFVALKGTSGSGKSTLLHLIGLLDRATAGRYELGGRDVSGLDDDALSSLRNRMLGFVFQSFYLIPYATALENVLLPGKYASTSQSAQLERAKMLLERVGLSDRMQFKPASLSGGQQQRVAMARALLNDPDVLLADEPTGQLDSNTSSEILSLFQDINANGKTIVMVTHDDDVAEAASRIINLHDGRIVEGGPRPAR